MTTSDSRLPDDLSDVEDIPPHSGRIRVALEVTVALLVLVGIYYLFAPREEIELPPLKPQEIDPIIRSRIEAQRQPAVRESSPETPATAPPPEIPALPTEALPLAGNGAPASLAEGDAARNLIAELRSGDKTLTPAEILGQARAYQQSGRPTDAYLLLFYAARQGDGGAAFALGTLNDPNHFTPEASPLQAADATQARKWYELAASQQVPQAARRLQALHDGLEKRAAAGDPAARRLLLNWP